MRNDDFATWLELNYVTRKGTRLEVRPRSDAKSRCKRVERYEGDLDMHFAQDKMEGLLQTLSNYQHRVPIDGDIVIGTASLRNAVNLYRLFCQDNPPQLGR
jgi:hypothetical protein